VIIDFFIAFLVALLLTWVFATALGTTGPWSAAWVFFVILLLFMWAIGLWVRPVGPAVWDGRSRWRLRMGRVDRLGGGDRCRVPLVRSHARVS